MNLPEVQKALNVKATAWQECGGVNYNSDMDDVSRAGNVNYSSDMGYVSWTDNV